MSRPEEQDEVLFDTSRKLDDAGIPHMLTGSFALAFYVHEFRGTNDLDIVIEARADHVGPLMTMFPESDDWYISESAVREAITQHRMFNVINSATGLKLDLIQLKTDEFEQLKFSRRQRVERDGVGFWIITPEDLLLSKLAWGKRGASALQANDVRVLIRDYPELDWSYANKWIDSLGLRDWFEEARQG